MAVPRCPLAYLGSCEGHEVTVGEVELAAIFKRVARQHSGERLHRGDGVCTAHYNLFCSKNWTDSKVARKVNKNAICAGCGVGKKGNRLSKKKTAFLQSWNNEHPLQPLPACSVMCGKCVADTTADRPTKRLKTDLPFSVEDGYNSDDDGGSDSGSLVYDSTLPNGGPLFEQVEPEESYCNGTWDTDGCLQDEELACKGCAHLGLTLCSRCMKYSNWTCMRCFTPYHISYDPNHLRAADHIIQRAVFERRDDDSITLGEPAEVKQPDMVDEPESDWADWTMFPILEESDESVLFIDSKGNHCRLPYRKYKERCEMHRLLDRRACQEGGNDLREHTFRRMLTLQEEGHFKGMLGGGNRLQTNAELQLEVERLKQLWANAAVEVQAGALREQALKDKLKDSAARRKAAERAAQRKAIRLAKAEEQLATLNARLKATLSEDGKLALVIDYIKSQIFGTNYVCLARTS
jgi:hypothetical protein